MQKRKILITPTIAVALLFLITLVVLIQVNEQVRENKTRIEELSQLTYENWKETQVKEISSIEVKMRKMTEERFNKMIEMQKSFSKNEIEKSEILKKDLEIFS